MSKKKKATTTHGIIKKWTDETKFEFANSRIRAYTYADRKKRDNKRACRKGNW